MDPPAFIPARESRTGEEAGFCIYKESTLEAVMERPVHDETGSVPEFNQSEWDRQMGAADVPDSGSKTQDDESLTIGQALGLPEDLADLWPHHVYLPPRLKDVERLTTLFGSLQKEDRTESEILGAMTNITREIQRMARRVEGSEVVKVTEDYIKEEFSGAEVVQIFLFILQDQGIVAEGVVGKSPSGREIGVKSFLGSAAFTESSPEDGESSPTGSIDS